MPTRSIRTSANTNNHNPRSRIIYKNAPNKKAMRTFEKSQPNTTFQTTQRQQNKLQTRLQKKIQQNIQQKKIRRFRKPEQSIPHKSNPTTNKENKNRKLLGRNNQQPKNTHHQMPYTLDKTMSNKKINYKIKCEKCGKFVNREEMINNYGRQTCRECLRTQTITKAYILYLPTFILKEAGLKANDKVIITNEDEEIIIRKKKNV